MTKTLLTLALEDVVIDDELDFRSVGHDVTELADSIAAFGLLQPITVAPANGDGKYHVVAGRRRFRAVAHLGQASIEAIVDDALTGERAQMIGQIIENLQREDVTALDEARAYAQLGDYQMKQKEIAAMVGVSASHVSARLALLKLPPSVAQAVNDGKVPVQVASRLARAPKPVRDAFDGKSSIDERAIAQIEADHKDTQARQALVKTLAERGILAVAAKERWGQLEPDAVAEAVGLGDGDKPKSHSWDRGAFLHRSHFEDEDAFLAAIASEKPAAVFVSGGTGVLRATCITSANLDRERKAAQAEAEAKAEAAREAAEREEHAFNRAVRAIMDSPDKGRLVAGVLFEFLTDQLRSHHTVDMVLAVAERLGWELTPPTEALDRFQELNHYETQLVERAKVDTATLIRAILASQRRVTPLLIDQGILADAELVASLPPHRQLAFALGGQLDEALISEEAAAMLAEHRAEEAEEEALTERINAEVESRFAAWLAEEGVDEADVEPEERDAMLEEIRLAVEVELDPGL